MGIFNKLRLLKKGSKLKESRLADLYADVLLNTIGKRHVAFAKELRGLDRLGLVPESLLQKQPSSTAWAEIAVAVFFLDSKLIDSLYSTEQAERIAGVCMLKFSERFKVSAEVFASAICDYFEAMESPRMPPEPTNHPIEPVSDLLYRRLGIKEVELEIGETTPSSFLITAISVHLVSLAGYWRKIHGRHKIVPD